MRLKSLKLNNFLSHADTEVSFKPEQKLLIDGPSGSGKSSLVDGIVWALYGEARADNKSLIKKGKKKATVTLTLDDDGKETVFKRAVSDKGTQTLDVTIDGKDIPATSLKEKQEYAEKQILKSSHSLFINAVVWPQDNAESFVRQTASKRKELLLELVGTGSFEDYLVKARAVASALEQAISTALATSSIHRTELEADKAALSQIKDVDLDEPAVEKEIVSLKSQSKEAAAYGAKKQLDLEAALAEVAKLDSLKAEVEGWKREETLLKGVVVDEPSIEAEIKGLEWTLGELGKVKIKLETLNQRKSANDVAVAQVAINEARRPLGLVTSLQGRLAALSVELGNEVNSSAANVCPTTKTPCVLAEAASKKRKEAIQVELAAVAAQLGEATKLNEEISRAVTAAQSVPAVDVAEIAQCETQLKDETGVSMKLQDLRRRLEASKANSKRLHEVQAALAMSVIDEVSYDINGMRAEVESLRDKEKASLEAAWVKENELRSYRETKALAESLKARISEREAKIAADEKLVVKSKEDAEAVSMVKDALGTNGIKVVIVDTVIPKLEANINEILSVLSDFRVHIDTNKESADGEKKVEGLYINILDEVGDVYPYENLSGGEKLKVTVAITEALASLQKSSFRVLDECVVGLDAESVQAFSEILLKLQERFSQVLAISHIKEVQNLFDEKVTVSKKGGTTTVS